MNEEKHAAFRRIAAGRIQDIKDKFRLLSNLASNNYEMTQEEVDQMFEVLTERLALVRKDFDKRLAVLNPKLKD